MLTKLLLVIAVIAIVYFFFIKKKPAKVQKTKDSSQQKLEGDDMVECASCGTYAQVDESILSNGKYYCCNECVQKG